MDCLFCKIAKGEIKSEKIFETEDVFVFLDIHPVSLGHSVIIPKKHAENILDLAEEKIGPLFQAVKKTTFYLSQALRPEGFTIGINHGKVTGQAIDHLHIHVMPRWGTDGGHSLHSVVQNSPQEPIAETAKKIREVNSLNA